MENILVFVYNNYVTGILLLSSPLLIISITYWSFICLIIILRFHYSPKQRLLLHLRHLLFPVQACSAFEQIIILILKSQQISAVTRIIFNIFFKTNLSHTLFLSELLGQAISNKLPDLINRDFLKVQCEPCGRVSVRCD